MKKYSDFPVYFVIIGLLLNMIMYFYNNVSFVELMIRSIVLIILFSIIGHLLATVLENAALAAAKHKLKSSMEKARIAQEEYNSTIDIRVESEDEDELLQTLKKSEDEFLEIGVENFKKFMNQD